MKSLSFEWNGEFYEICGYRGAAIGHVEKVRVGRSKQWCLVSDDLSWWRPDCLRQVVDFIDSLDTKAAPDSASHNKPSAPLRNAKKCKHGVIAGGYCGACHESMYP